MFECRLVRCENQEAEVARLEGEIAEVCGVLNAATGRLVDLIAKVLATDAWTGAGIRSPEHWVAWQCGVSGRPGPGPGRHGPPSPRAPRNPAAFRAGEVSEDQAKVICQYAPTHHDAEVADFARLATVTQLHRTLSRYVAAPEPPGRRTRDSPRRSGGSASGPPTPASGGSPPCSPSTKGR